MTQRSAVFTILKTPCLSCPVEFKCLDHGIAKECDLISSWCLKESEK